MLPERTPSVSVGPVNSGYPTAPTFRSIADDSQALAAYLWRVHADANGANPSPGMSHDFLHHYYQLTGRAS